MQSEQQAEQNASSSTEQRGVKRKADEEINESPAKKQVQVLRNADGDAYFELSKVRRVTVRKFRGKPLVDIREYYRDKNTDELRPGKKGISLNPQQFETLKDVLAAVQEQLDAIAE